MHLSAERTKKIPAGASRETHARSSPEMEQPSVNGTDPVELFYPKEASMFAAVCAVVLAVIGIAGLLTDKFSYCYTLLYNKVL